MPISNNGRKNALRSRLTRKGGPIQVGGKTVHRDPSIKPNRPGSIGPALMGKAQAMSQKPGAYASYQPGQKGPQQGPNIHGGNLKAKLSYLRQRRDAFQAAPKTQTLSDGTTVTQSGGKQQSKIDYIKNLMARQRSQKSAVAGNKPRKGQQRSGFPR